MSEGGSFMSSDWLGAFLIIAILFGGGFGFGGGRGPAPYPVNVATVQDVSQAVDNQATQEGIRDILLSSSNNNYETARLIDNQTMFLSNQNNTNVLTAVNGFNAVNQNIASGFADVRQGLASLGAQMNECCCSIKTMMLENRLQDTQLALQNAQNQAVNAEQTQYLLGQMGKWYPNSPATTTTG
jgi:hypothetical protein